MQTRNIESDGSRAGGTPSRGDGCPTTPQTERVPAIRRPHAADAAGIWRLVERTPSLDANSVYAYLLLCTDFAATGAVAELDGEIAGFVLGYRPPARPEALFVWQIGVGETARGRGLAGALLDHVLSPLRAEGVRFLEATVTPSNGPSWSLFRSFARRAGVACREAPAFPSNLFPDGGHEEELLLRIGPLHPESLRPRP